MFSEFYMWSTRTPFRCSKNSILTIEGGVMRNLTIIRFMKEGHATQSRTVNFIRGGPLYANSTCTQKCQ